ncbi:hypothetical protein LEP1GSC133_4072 [Leptospira borgpetersenii serovar Pomona str. 200901868]|uniref:Uncharacterized protein n=1 Tax=Leptospira borgpetersenii serovar Pomona str. 200901868 TaxID=1192866 RepID=M6W6I2_LEPBO|nr:hypothetical protein LEP1GSC133_4072 [Leptospira borgpetersenii serovar Pomona str. 200901868]
MNFSKIKTRELKSRIHGRMLHRRNDCGTRKFSSNCVCKQVIRFGSCGRKTNSFAGLPVYLSRVFRAVSILPCLAKENRVAPEGL